VAHTDSWIAVVSGLPRSGTSMMMRMLDAGGLPTLTDFIRAPDDDNPNGYYEFEPVKQVDREASWLEDARGKAVKMVYSLVYKLPKTYNFKVILMTRSLDEVLASQDTMLRRHGKGGAGPEQARLKPIFEAQLREFGRWADAQDNVEVIKVDYNRMILDTRACVAEVNRFLGGDLDVEAMARVYDPSLYRQRL
jgi:hypothetical protein